MTNEQKNPDIEVNKDLFGRRTIAVLPQVFGVAAAALGIMALVGWIFEHPLLSTFGAGLIPMAPSTALLFILLGFAVFFRNRFPLNRRGYFIGTALGLFSALTSLLLFFLSSEKIHSPVEHLGIPIEGTIDGAPIGHMSPVTAISFLVIALSFLATLHLNAKRPKQALAAFWAAFLIVLTFLVFVLAYLFGAPLLYGDEFIPPALPTSLAFLLLAIGILADIALQIWTPTREADLMHSRLSYSLVLVFATLTTGIIVTGYYYYHNFGQQYKREIEHQLSAIADLKVDELVQWRKERMGHAATFYRNENFSGRVKQFLETPSSPDARRKLRTWMRQFQEVFQYDLLCLHDTTLAERFSYPGEPEPTDSFSFRKAVDTMRTHKIAFQDFYKNEHNGRVYLNLYVPILDVQNSDRLIAVLAMRIDPETYLYPQLKRWPTPSRTAETLLVRRDGNDVLFLNDLRFREHSALNLRSPLTDARMTAVKAALGEEGIVQGVDYRRVPVLAHVRAVPDSPWFLVARMDISEVNEPLKERLWLTMFIMGALLMGAGTGVGMMWRQQRARYYREQYVAERERAWLQDVIARSLNEIYVFDPQTLRFRFVNAGARRNIGYTEQELTRLTLLDIKPAYTENTFRKLVQPLLHGEDKVLVFQTVHRRKDGSQYAVEVHLQFVERPEGAVFLAIVNDITERKRAEENVRKLNRVYAVLSDINQAIVRVREPQTLFKKVCSIAVDKGKFPFAWVGLIDESTQKLLPVAFAGKSDGYLDKINISIKNKPKNYSPIDEALQEGQHVICNAIEQDENIAPYQKTALKLGLHSSAAFPLKVHGKVRGAISFYAEEPYFFDEEELQLLDELAMDIAFAMEFSEKETERKKSEEALRESEERYRLLFESNPHPMWVYDLETLAFLAVNDAAVQHYGYSRDEFLSMTIKDIRLPQDIPELLNNVSQSLEGLEESGQWRHQKKDGTVIDVEIISHSHIWAGRRARVVRAHDITERKKAEDALRESRETLETIIETSPVSVIVTNPQGEVILWNQASETTFGWSAAEAISQPNPIIPPDKHAEVRRVRRQILKGKTFIDFETERLRKDGKRITVSFSATALRNTQGQADRILAIVTDITERKQAEEEISRLNEELEQKVLDRTAQLEAANKELEAFSYSVSHDLRAPLRHIGGFIELLQQNARNSFDEKSIRYINIISDSAQRMGQLIDDLLDFSRMGRTELQPGSLDLNRLVKEILLELKQETKGRNIDWKIDTLPEIYADKSMMRLVVANLISNAAKYTRTRKKARIEIGSMPGQDDKKETIFFIRDNGVGFDPKYTHKLFGVFQRLHRKEEFEGTGIGLANVRRIIHRHGGRTWAEGAVDKGATIFFTIPHSRHFEKEK